MNKSFIVLDKTNNVQKNANAIIKFGFEGKDYVIYSIDENEQNKQIFTSKIILNSEGKYFIEDIIPEEKNKLSNIVYNIVILTPSNAKKGGVPADLIKELTEKYFVTLSTDIPNLENQEYFANCSIAITNKEFVDEAIKFYSENLNESSNTVEEKVVPTWSLPTEETTNAVNPVVPEEVITSETPVITTPTENLNVETPIEQNVVTEQPQVNIPQEPIEVPVLEQPVPNTVEPINLNPTPEVSVAQTQVVQPVQMASPEPAQNNNMPNPQTEKLAVVSDPSLGLTDVNMQPNVGKKNAGFAINKYIIIGSICLLLAVAVVVVAYFLIQKKINGA